MSERHSRQVRLADVGLEGQRRIASSTHVVRGGGLSASVTARYLAGAGVKAIDVEDERVAACARDVDATVDVRISDGNHDPEHDLDVDPEWAGDLELPARDVALGAWRALRALRRVVLFPREMSP